MDQNQYLNSECGLSEPSPNEPTTTSTLDPLETELESLPPVAPDSPSMSRKRARTSCTSDEIEELLACSDSSQESATHTTAVQNHSSPTPVRDDTYYFEDGSFVVQVEDTLFNVSNLITGGVGCTIINGTLISAGS